MLAEILSWTQEELASIFVSVAMVALAALVGRWLITLLINRIIKRVVSQTETTLDDMMVEAARPPLTTLLVIFVAEAAYNRLGFLPEEWTSTVATIFFVLYLVVGVSLILRIVARFFDWYQSRLERTTEVEVSEQLLPFFRRVFRVIVLAIAFIMFLNHFEVDVSGLVATLGVTSIAIALAAQAALEDTLSGFLIILDQPYRITDRIEIVDLDTVGDVQDIGLRSTRILTVDNRMVVVPNSVIGKSLVVNRSHPDTLYRTETAVGVAYGTDIRTAREVIKQAVRDCGVVVESKPVEALFVEFGDSALVFEVRWWVNEPTDVLIIADQVNTAIYEALNAAGISIPFPQRDLNLSEVTTQRLAAALNGK